MNGNMMIKVEIIKKSRFKHRFNRNLTPTKRFHLDLHNKTNYSWVQNSFAVDSSHHFEECKSMIPDTKESPKKKKSKFHVLEFHSRRKENIRTSLLRQESSKTNRSLSPSPSPNFDKLPKIPKKTGTSSPNKIKLARLKEISSSYKSYSTLCKNLKIKKIDM